MNAHSSQPKNTGRIFSLLLVIFLLGSALVFPNQTAQAQSDQLFRQHSFKQHSFEVKGFSFEQEDIIEATLQAYAQALGGSRKLRNIIKNYNHGENWTITYDPNGTGADSSMKLSPTVFSREKAATTNYSCYAAADEAANAQIVIGHEISHLLIRAVKARSGINWSKSYQQWVQRDWTSINNIKAPEEEAVTELSLNVLQMGYYFSINADSPEANPEVVAEIDAWVADFLAALQNLK